MTDECRRHRVLPSSVIRHPSSVFTAFRNYADYAATPEFRAGFAELLAVARAGRAAIMCAEAAWWRCHRRIIADYLLAAGVAVEHIFTAEKSEPARLTPGAVCRPDGTLRYAGNEALLL